MIADTSNPEIRLSAASLPRHDSVSNDDSSDRRFIQGVTSQLEAFARFKTETEQTLRKYEKQMGQANIVLAESSRLL